MTLAGRVWPYFKPKIRRLNTQINKLDTFERLVLSVPHTGERSTIRLCVIALLQHIYQIKPHNSDTQEAKPCPPLVKSDYMLVMACMKPSQSGYITSHD